MQGQLLPGVWQFYKILCLLWVSKHSCFTVWVQIKHWILQSLALERFTPVNTYLIMGLWVLLNSDKILCLPYVQSILNTYKIQMILFLWVETLTVVCYFRFAHLPKFYSCVDWMLLLYYYYQLHIQHSENKNYSEKELLCMYA